MLVLVVHSVTQVTAKIDFSMMVLLDIVKKGLQGNDFRCRQVLPTSGHRSCSVWDVPDIKSFQEWLDETMEANCESEVFEVQEEFALGVPSEVIAARAAEKIARDTKATANNVTAFASQIDDKYKVSEQAAVLAKRAKEQSDVVQKNTVAAFANMNTMAKSWSSKVAENQNVATTAEAMRGFGSKLGASFKSLQDSLTTKLDMPAYGAQPAAAAAGKEGTSHAETADTAAPALPAPEAERRSEATAPAGSAVSVKPEHAFSLDE